MTARPILFSAPMIRSLLEGRKTQTRRVIHLYPSIDGRRFPVFPPEEIIELEPGEFSSGTCHYASTGALSGPYRLPYSVGDMLWVREKFHVANVNCWADLPKSRVPAGGAMLGKHPLYDDQAVYFAASFDRSGKPIYHPAIHMPRWASRLTLEVTDVRVEQLQEISEEDAEAEGAAPILTPPDGGSCPHVEGFRTLWYSINAARGFGWDSNPWVVALTFRVHPMNIDNLLKRRETA